MSILSKETSTRIYETCGPAVLRPLVARSARDLIDRVVGGPITPSEGLFYIVRFTSGWQAFTLRFDEFPTMDHHKFWRRFLCPILAQDWCETLRKSPTMLEDRLRPHAHGFPRGRVGRASDDAGFDVFHGGDSQPYMGTPVATIERLFSLPSAARWLVDEREAFRVRDRDAVCSILQM